MLHNHNNKTFPAYKMFPRRMRWVTPNPTVPYPEYGELIGRKPFEERNSSRGHVTKQVMKRIHTKKSRQYFKVLDATQEET